MPRTLEARVEQIGPATSQGSVRSHSVVIDRPVEKGGADRGPMGGELLLLSLAGCFLSNLLAAVASRAADVSDIRIAITGTLGGSPERFEAMEMRVSAKYADAELMRKLV